MGRALLPTAIPRSTLIFLELPILVTRGYQMAMSTVGDITVESHFSSKDAAVGRKVLEHATNALRVAQEKLGPFPYRRFRVVQAHLTH